MSVFAFLAVFEFEFRRTLTWQRSLIALGLSLFPGLLIGLVMALGGDLESARGEWEIFVFVLVPEVTCIMGLLLWATPSIHTELEEKTWHYLSMRPVRRGKILFGKYLSAVAWTLVCASVSLLLCLLVLREHVNVAQAGGRFALLILLSSAVYGAIYTLIGVLFPHRAMVAAVAYTAVMEGLVAWLPATINHFSVQYHLRCLLMKWIVHDPVLPDPEFQILFFSTLPAWRHVVVLVGLGAGLLTVASLVLNRRQLV